MRLLDAWRLRPQNGSDGYWLQEDAYALELLQNALGRRDETSKLYRIVGDRVTYGIAHGEKRGRLGLHADEPLQGGTHSLLVYLNDIPEGSGGGTRFHEGEDDGSFYRTVSVRPEHGKGIVFDIVALHDTEPIAKDHSKFVVACEVIKL